MTTPDNIDSSSEIIQQAYQQGLERAKEYDQEINGTQKFLTQFETPEFNPKGLKRKKKTLQERGSKLSKTLEGKREGRLINPIEKRKDTANQFSNRNPELDAKDLLSLAEKINKDDTAEQILQKVRQTFGDVTLADEALEFLVFSAILEGHSEMTSIEEAQTWLAGNEDQIEDNYLLNLLQARSNFNAEFGRQIRAGYRSSEQARDIADSVPGVAQKAKKEGLTTTSYLRGMYRKITGEETKFDQVYQDFKANDYSYSDMVKVTNFFYHSIGSDLNSDGPSIEPGKLHVLMQQVKILQAVMGVYRWWKGREPLLEKLFDENQLNYPEKSINFETLSREFIDLLADRYPQSSKLSEAVQRLQADKQETQIYQVMAKIFVIQQFRDAIPNVDPKRIPSLANRKEQFLDVILKTLEDWENDLSDLELAEEENQFFDEGG